MIKHQTSKEGNTFLTKEFYFDIFEKEFTRVLYCKIDVKKAIFSMMSWSIFEFIATCSHKKENPKPKENFNATVLCKIKLETKCFDVALLISLIQTLKFKTKLFSH
jgi:hypothetical protein